MAIFIDLKVAKNGKLNIAGFFKWLQGIGLPSSLYQSVFST